MSVVNLIFLMYFYEKKYLFTFINALMTQLYVYAKPNKQLFYTTIHVIKNSDFK